MDEVSSHGRLDPAVTTVRPTIRLFHLVFESHDGRALVPIPKRSTSPRGDIDDVAMGSLKALDPEWPIREAAVSNRSKAAVYSITSSARCWRRKGTSRPSVLAVLRLITSSNLTGAWTGSS